jgi:ribosomal protein L37AE/L43A
MLIFIGGLFFLLASCLFLGTPGLAGGFSFWVGIGLMAVGWFISDSANKKTCPQCAERVKYEAKKCRHCGHEFAAAARSSVSEPFYK